MSARTSQTLVAVAVLIAWATIRALGVEDLPLSELLPMIGAWLAPSPVTITQRG